MIRDAGAEPRERDALYRPVDDAGAETDEAAPARAVA
jgi:hypothetical protein